MSGVLSLAVRARVSTRLLAHTRCLSSLSSVTSLSSLSSVTEIEQLFAAEELPVWQARPKRSVKPRPALAVKAEVDQVFGAKPGVLPVERCLEEELRRSLARAATQQGELQAQLLKQQDLSAKHSQLITQSLEVAAAERAQLQGQVDKLFQDLHALTAQLLKEQVGVRERIQRTDVQGRGGQSRMAYRPTIANAERQPTHVCEMSHQSLAELAMSGNHCAMRERLLREIMAVEGISWGAAHEVLSRLDQHNERYYWLESMPYRVGITVALIGGVFGSVMVFYKPVALWYGENIAGESLPEGVTDISELTTNQVGAWTWGWMEPMIGTASFVLLCAHFGRSQAMQMNMKTYAEHLLTWRANRLAKRFPCYDSSMVRAWAKHMPPVDWMFFPMFERRAGYRGSNSGL